MAQTTRWSLSHMHLCNKNKLTAGASLIRHACVFFHFTGAAGVRFMRHVAAANSCKTADSTSTRVAA